MLITRTIQLSPQALNILDAIASELELHDLSEAVEYCILKQKLDEKELAHALLARLSSGSLRPVDDENSCDSSGESGDIASSLMATDSQDDAHAHVQP